MGQAEVVMEERESVLPGLERECSERMKIFTFQPTDFSRRGDSYPLFYGKKLCTFLFFNDLYGLKAYNSRLGQSMIKF